MREIEFRGKFLYGDKEWKYGEFHHGCIESDRNYDIDLNTLGQYTGLKDKNGKKIFEGDVVKLKETNYNYEWTAVIEFGNPNSEYIWGWNLKPIKKDVEYNLDILCWVEMPYGATCEIIGNIYDNPELFKGEKNGN